MLNPQKTVGALFAVLLLILVLAVFAVFQKPPPPIVLSWIGTSPSSNTNMMLISINVSNRSEANMVFHVFDARFKTNGAWGTPQLPNGGTKLSALGAHQSITVTNFVPNAAGEARVPVLWGFNDAFGGTHWQQLKADFTAWLRTRDLRGAGALYTNYLEGIKLEAPPH